VPSLSLKVFIVMQHSRHTASYRRRLSRFRRTFGTGLITALMSAPGLFTATAAIHDVRNRIEALAALATGAPMLAVTAGPFLMGTGRSNSGPFSLDLQYDDTEQPQRRIWLDGYEIDRDKVSLGEHARWMGLQPRPFHEELRKLVDHVTSVHALSSETMTR
jgi:formylglycine-generating enzyme required for sulfatase activity